MKRNLCLGKKVKDIMKVIKKMKVNIYDKNFE